MQVQDIMSGPSGSVKNLQFLTTHASIGSSSATFGEVIQENGQAAAL